MIPPFYSMVWYFIFDLDLTHGHLEQVRADTVDRLHDYRLNCRGYHAGQIALRVLAGQVPGVEKHSLFDELAAALAVIIPVQLLGKR